MKFYKYVGFVVLLSMVAQSAIADKGKPDYPSVNQFVAKFLSTLSESSLQWPVHVMQYGNPIDKKVLMSDTLRGAQLTSWEVIYKDGTKRIIQFRRDGKIANEHWTRSVEMRADNGEVKEIDEVFIQYYPDSPSDEFDGSIPTMVIIRLTSALKRQFEFDPAGNLTADFFHQKQSY